ncbi:MAG: UPF0182 family protein [Xenococcaceae cyanobacterium MO_167.B27]|nr:UPF0182 family protein [Xenococcaceae cyanobacterium MO_167.B27]
MMKLRIPNLLRLIFILLLFWFASQIVVNVLVEILWFQEVNYLPILIKKWQTQIILGTVVFSTSSLYLGTNIYLANRWRWHWLKPEGWIKNSITYINKNDLSLTTNLSNKALASTSLVNSRQFQEKTSNKYKPPTIPLYLLLFLVILSCLAFGLLLLYYGYLTFDTWLIDKSLFGSFPQLLSNFQETDNIDIIPYFKSHIREIIFLIFLSGLIIFTRRLGLIITAITFSILFGLMVAGNWTAILQFYQPTSFNYTDPQFGRDIEFYIFILPILKLAFLWLNGLFVSSFMLIFLNYLLSGNSLSEGKFPGFSINQIRHLFFLSGMVMLSVSLYHWLNRFNILYSDRGVVYGAGYTDITVQLPVEVGLTVLSVMLAFWLIVKSFTGYKIIYKKVINRRKMIIFLLPLLIYISLLVFGNFSSLIIQRFSVQPNELAKETPFIKRSIAITRKAFGLEEIETQTFNPQNELTLTDIQDNDLTIKNIRLWDTRPILATNRQLQQIRLYYKFPDADIDRYFIGETATNKNKQQVIIAARELDYNSVPERAKTWVNEHLVYTHGYGFTLSPVNKVEEGGLPYYYVKDIGTGNQELGNLTVSSPLIRETIPIGEPRIYYGEITDTYVMTSTKARELDYPSGETNIYNTYSGNGGIKIGNYGLRVLFARYLKDWQIMFTQNFTPKTKLLLRRNIAERVATIAPFLRYDRDPYLVVANTESESESESESNNHLYWIIDAYTTSNFYPYSDPGKNSFNYIRNSVKVVVDGYNGDVDFYIAEPQDPIIKTWNKIFPQLFHPLSEMPTSLLDHIRYPEDLFSIQSERLLIYHMKDPQVFYNREDQWQSPQEIYGAESQPVEPYYLIMRLPTEEKEEFILLHPYTPVSRPNLIAWLAARSDGAEYGNLLLYKFPKQKLVYGPDQIEALINQDPVISQQISLWNREGSRAIQGNLLIIPIEQSLLYVEPFYIEAERNSLPTLARVIVVYENQIVMAETLQEAIDAIFNLQEDTNRNNAIVRPVEQL